eukprot:CAMPEP_0179430590 /NCGR_PEP_ID=MMETSP0799-20121207/15698_1 /TAXON_ID=46947 /ORGANISM="Geminigera cryophila, Strain CCMP2564" /LENGTH=339 /DNA_ID=CAMNT_0021207109 /DNA_START=654 /DNA_END=1673 /DNA_ORIENTATION=-
MHCNDGDPKTIVPVLVTACLDRLDIKYPVTLNLGTDLELQGQVSWTSNSSVQININLCQKDDNSPNTETKLSASMVFVHVQNGRAAPVNKIKPVTPSDVALFAAGEKANAERKMNRKTSLKSAPPTPEESQLLHTAMLSGFGNEAVGLLSTKMEAVQLMQPQERNRAGKIFGGFLMHEAYELAYTTSAAYAASLGATGQIIGAPTVIAVDDISFSKPVSIGDVVIFTSKVVYTGSNELLVQQSNKYPNAISCVFQVRVLTKILDLKTGQKHISNEFHFTFLSRDPDAMPRFPVVPCRVAPIAPKSYTEGMLWIDGRRRMLEALEIAKSTEGFANEALFK